MGKRPGVMFYFSIRPCLKRLSAEEKGRLFEAMLDYAEFGREPSVDGVLGVAWDFVQPLIDQDEEKYQEKCLKNQYSTYVREAKKTGKNVLPYDDWKENHEVSVDAVRHRSISDDIISHPITIPITDSIPIPITNSPPTPSRSMSSGTSNQAKAEKHCKNVGRNAKKQYGEYANVLLADDELQKLKEQFPQDYQDRIERLSEYVASTGKVYKSHYATIRAWARKDVVSNGKSEAKSTLHVGIVV